MFGKRGLAALACIAVGLFSVGCGSNSNGSGTVAKAPAAEKGGKPETKDLIVIGDWLPWASQGPIWAAIKNGYYKDAGLNVTIKAPANPTDPVKLVTTGRAQFGMSYVPEVIASQEKGIPVQSVGALLRVLNSGLFSNPKSNIKSPCDLKGKVVAVTQKPDAKAIVDTILQKCNMTEKDVKMVDAGFASNKLVDTGKAAAAWGIGVYEGALYKSQNGSDPSWLYGRENGVPPFYWMLLVGNPQWMSQNPNSTRAFLAATQKGVEAYRQDPVAITDFMSTQNEVVDKKSALAMAEAAKPQWVDSDTTAHGILWEDGAQWEAALKWMKASGLVKQGKPVSDYFTNAYLPTK